MPGPPQGMFSPQRETEGERQAKLMQNAVNKIGEGFELGQAARQGTRPLRVPSWMTDNTGEPSDYPIGGPRGYPTPGGGGAARMSPTGLPKLKYDEPGPYVSELYPQGLPEQRQNDWWREPPPPANPVQAHMTPGELERTGTPPSALQGALPAENWIRSLRESIKRAQQQQQAPRTQRWPEGIE